MSITTASFHMAGKACMNNVHRDQYNSYHTIVNQVSAERTEYDEFDYVKRGCMVTVKELDSQELKEWEWESINGQTRGRLRRSAHKTICTVELRPDRQSKYTAVIYEGDDALSFWEDDFKRFSLDRQPDTWQLFGINHSQVPFLIFHDELVPWNHFYEEFDSFWVDVFINHWMREKRCVKHNLWMNAQGVLCKGPQGPSGRFSMIGAFSSVSDVPLIPSTKEMLDDGTSLEFFRQFKLQDLLDKCVVQIAWNYGLQNNNNIYVDDLFPEVMNHNWKHPGQWKCKKSDCTEKHPYLRHTFHSLRHELLIDVIGKLHFDTVYSPSWAPVARWPGALWVWETEGLRGGNLVRDGLSKFTLWHSKCHSVKLRFSRWRNEFYRSWLSQSLNVMDVFEAEQMVEKYLIPEFPEFQLISILHSHHRGGGTGTSHSNYRSSTTEFAGLDHQFASTRYSHMNYSGLTGSSTVQKVPPIYLFLYPPPKSILELVSCIEGHTRTHFWSFDENGQSEMSEEECERWKVPKLTPSVPKYSHLTLRSWPKRVYAALHEWQITQGFDPTTPDFARHLGYRELEIIGTKMASKSRFKEATKDQPEATLSESGDTTATFTDSNSKAFQNETLNVGEPAGADSEANVIAATVQDTDKPEPAVHVDVNSNVPRSQSTSVVIDALDETGTDKHATETKDTGNQETKNETNFKSWSWWSWEAIPGSDISAFLI